MKNLNDLKYYELHTQKEIYQALIDGKKIIHKLSGKIVYIKGDGSVNADWYFSYPEDWSIKCEPLEHEPILDISVCKHCGVRLKMVWVGA